MKVFEIVASPQESLSGAELYRLPNSEAAKIIKNNKFSLTPGEWKKDGSYDWVNENGDRVVFNSVTIYGKNGRLREPSKTKYLVYVVLTFSGSGSVTVDFGSARGESFGSSEKIRTIKGKVQAWAKKSLGIELGEYGFKQ
jgi:hypothetical protein